MKLDIGGGHNPKEGFQSIDIIKEADFTVNLEREKIPLPDESVEEIFTQHTFEHIGNLIHVMNECWRVLQWNGRMEIIVPHMDCVLAWQDPTHKRFFNTESMKFFEGYYTNKYKLDYGIQCAFKKIKCEKRIVKEKTDSENLEEKTYFIEIKWILEKNKEYYEENKPFNLISEEKCPKVKTGLEEINQDISDEMNTSFRLFKKKNKDYNNSYFAEDFAKTVYFSNFTRKYKRLEQFYVNAQEFEVEDETVYDTLRDLAIYSLMEIVRLKREKR